MLEADLHCHSHFSLCGIHSVLELLHEARRKGLKLLAITDHGPATGANIPSTFFDRLGQPLEGITLLKGMECNPLGPGRIDTPHHLLPHMDLVLLGFHHVLPRRSARANTRILLRCLDRNPFVDIITHPGFDGYPLELPLLCREAAARGVAVELNNSKLRYSRQTPDEFRRIIDACGEASCRVAVTSDTHAIHELGDDRFVTPLLEEAGFPGDLVVSRSAETALAFVEERRPLKRPQSIR